MVNERIDKFLRRPFNILLVTAICLVTIVLVYILFETFQAKNTGFQNKTLWDWMDLLIVPLFLGIGIWWLNRSEKDTEREIASYRARQSDLQAYIKSMTELLLEHGLRKANQNNEVCTIARTITLTVLSQLSGVQKGQVLQFLHESGLIERIPVLKLNGADLNQINLFRAALNSAYLRETDIQNANLVRANLFRANLQRARLQNTNLSGAVLVRANLREAFMQGTNLREAVLRDADFRWAVLSQADLTEADLKDTDLRRTDLSGANFTDAVLINTDLQDAQVLMEQLQKARHLQNITLPDGSIYSNNSPLSSQNSQILSAQVIKASSKTPVPKQ